MAHFPINHPLRPVYRVLAALAGLYVVVFGIVGLNHSTGTGLFGREHTYALGLRTNMAFSILSIAVGVLVFAGALYGRKIDQFVNLAAGTVFLLAGLVMLSVMQTGANLLNFTVATCVVSFLIGLVLLAAGLYGNVAAPEAA